MMGGHSVYISLTPTLPMLISVQGKYASVSEEEVAPKATIVHTLTWKKVG